MAHACVPIQRETSTPARLMSKPGGVATNIARSLTRLDVPAILCGALGDDPAGTGLLNTLTAEGISVTGIRRNGFPTGQYLAFHDPDGSLAAACVDDRVLGEAPADIFDRFLQDALPAADENAIWFVDTNLPEQVLLAICRQLEGRKIMANAVSDAKATRLQHVLPSLSLLTLNRSEAIALTGLAADTHSRQLMERLLAAGAARVAMTCGQDGLYTAQDGNVLHHPALPAEVVDVTGAGDALTAGILAGLAHGHEFSDAVSFGLKAAQITLSTEGALSEKLSWAALQTN
nr:PfkB family carbohydrate kinase [Roseibium denhamense]